MWKTIAPGSTDLLLRECWAPKTLHLEFLFFLAKLAVGQGTAHASTTDKVHNACIGQARYKKKTAKLIKTG